MADLKEMRLNYAKLIKENRDILDKAEKEKRSLTSEEEQQYNRIDEDIDKLQADIQREERQQEREAEMRKIPGDIEKPNPEEGAEQRNKEQQELRNQAFTKYLTRGQSALNQEEFRALQADIDPDGGFLVPPEQFVTQLIKQVDNQVFIRGLATVNTVKKAMSLGVPTLENNPSDADWTSELATGNEDAAMSFGKRELAAHPLAKRIKVSNKLLRAGALSAEAIVRDRLAYKFGVTLEKAYMSGTGNNQPLGIFTPSKDGISTSRDIVGSNTSTDLTADGLVDAKYSLKPQYYNKAKWIFHRGVVKEIRKLKDNYGQYLMGPLSQVGAHQILDIPFIMSEYAPNTMTSGKYVGAIGDFSHYWILDALDMQIQRLVELYAPTNQTGFIGRYEGDGMPVLEEAFARVTLG